MEEQEQRLNDSTFFREPIPQSLALQNICDIKVFVTLQAQVFLEQIFENCVFIFASVPLKTFLFGNIFAEH